MPYALLKKGRVKFLLLGKCGKLYKVLNVRYNLEVAMAKEKIYFEEGDVSITASRVVLGNENFVLRNISAVKVQKEAYGTMGKVFVGCFAAISLLFLYTESSGGVVLCLILGGLCLLLKNRYYVQVSSGGTPTNTISSKEEHFPAKIVEAINNALLDLDKNEKLQKANDESESGTSATDEVMKLKGLLDAGAITQEEFDTKKKELLGL